MLPAAREVRSQELGVITWDKLKSLVLDSLTSPHSRRAYGQALDHFHVWAAMNSPEGFTKATVQRYRAALEQEGLAPSSINIRLSAIRKLANEAADNGVFSPETAAAIRPGQGRQAPRHPHRQLADP